MSGDGEVRLQMAMAFARVIVTTAEQMTAPQRRQAATAIRALKTDDQAERDLFEGFADVVEAVEDDPS